MYKHLKKYIWQFFWLYLLFYILAMAVFILLDNLANAQLHDIVIIGALGFILPHYLCKKFIANENRFLDENEQKYLVKRVVWIAFFISSLDYIIYFGWGLLLRMLVPQNKMQWLMTNAHIDPKSQDGFFLQIPMQYLLLLIGATVLLYYGLQWFAIRNGFKRERKKYEKSKLEITTV